MTLADPDAILPVKTGVIGHPVGHSKSPLIHDYWMERHNIKGEYHAIDIFPDNLRHDVRALVDQGYAGFNVTVPHKETISDLCETLDDAAQKIGATNLIRVQDGKLIGSNSDAFGFSENIKQKAPDFDFKAGPVMVLGAGGAARAVIYALLMEGVPKLYLSNRTQSRAEQLAQHFGDLGAVEVIPWDQKEDSLPACHALVNTTLLGMIGQPPLEIRLDGLSRHALVNDIVYNPLITDLLRKAMEQGCKTVGGIGMLLHQARPAFQAWHGVMPEVDQDLERLVMA